MQFYLNDGAVAKIIGEECGVNSGRHEDHSQVRICMGHVSKKNQREISICVSLMNLEIKNIRYRYWSYYDTTESTNVCLIYLSPRCYQRHNNKDNPKKLPSNSLDHHLSDSESLVYSIQYSRDPVRNKQTEILT